MHHKVLIIDGQVVVTGSYNISRSAEERNDEAIIVVHNTYIAQQLSRNLSGYRLKLQNNAFLSLVNKLGS